MTALIELYNAVSHQSLVDQIVTEFGLIDINGNDSAALNKHRLRRDEMAERVRLYRDDAAADIAHLIDLIWDRPDYREKLKKYIGLNSNGTMTGRPVALAQNVSCRLVHEVASLYDKPAVRILKTDQKAFKLEEKRLRLHEITQDYHRLLWLCNDVLLWQFAGINDATKLKVVTPDVFDAIPHPADCTMPGGLVLQMPPVSLLPALERARLPQFELWDDTFRYLINSSGKICDASGEQVAAPEKHGLDRIPGVVLHRREPSERCLDPRAGRDIAACHRGVVLLNIMILRISKTQGERQPVLKGNLANYAKGQTADGENPIVLPPEVEAMILDTVTDPEHLIKTKRELLISTGQTYGVSYEQLTFEETTSTAGSGKLYQVRREKLTELRGEQRRRALINEAESVDLIGFQSDDMKVDHQEQAVPQDAAEEMQLLDLKTKIGMDSPVKAIMRKDPDLSREEALAVMKENLDEWLELIKLVRQHNIPLDATAANPGNDPQINGSGRVVQKIDVGQLAGGSQNPPLARG